MTTHSHRLPNGAIPVLLSADAPEMLAAEAAQLLAYLAQHPRTSPDAIADMVFRTRSARKHRALCMIGDHGLDTALRALVDGHDHPAVVRTTTATSGRVGFVFPGQGSQRPGMGRAFYESNPAYRAEADRCAALFAEQFGPAPLKYLLEDGLSADDAASTVQPALFIQMAGLAAAWRSVGVDPQAVIGHSQGELAAAYVAGAMTLEDAVRVVSVRAHAADEFAGGDYAMAVVAASRDECEDVLARFGGWTQLSVVNSPSMVGISGERSAVRGLVDGFTERGVFARVIRVRYPAHTVLMNDIGPRVRAEFQAHLHNPRFLDSEIPLLGATLGGPISDELAVDDYWFLNLRNTVRFDRAIAAAVDCDVDAFVELADHPTLQLAIRENLAAVGDDRARVVIGTSTRDAGGLDEFTRNVALAAVHLPDFDWTRLGVASNEPPRRPLLDFPNSVMRQTRAWLPGHVVTSQPQAAVDAAPRPAGNHVAGEARSPRLLSERWPRLTSRSLTPPRNIGFVDHTGGFGQLVSELSSAAMSIGATARAVGADGTDGLDTVVILLPPSAAEDDDAAAAEVGAFFAQRTWWPELADTVRECWLLTFGGERVLDDDAPPDVVAAAASAGFRSIGAEHPGVRFRHLDLGGPTDPAPAVIAALHTEGESELGLRDGALHAKRIVEMPSAPESFEPPRHALIVGGTGSLGLELCEHLARTGAGRITLVSRSGETPAVTQRLRPIRSATSTVIEVSRCDVGDALAVAALADRNRDAPADLIAHCAVVYTGDELADITAAKVEESLRAKVVGAARVLDAFPRTSNCRVVLFSSIGANVGGRGMVVYAASNRMLDAMAHRLRRDGLDCVAVQWGYWAVTFDLEDVGTAKLSTTGMVPMTADDALALGLARLSGNAIVASFDLERARTVLEVCGRGSLLAELTSRESTTTVRVDGIDPSQRFMNLLAHAIGVDGSGEIDTTIPLVAIGLDSLQALEVQRRVKAEFDLELEVADLLGGATVDDVLARLV